jgi:hypothetical protein
MSKSADGAPTRKRAPVSQTDFADRAGVNRSTISRAFQGPLKAALLPGKRCDVTHPAVTAWARDRGLDPRVLLGKFGALHSALKEARGETPTQAAANHEGGMTIEEFAARAEVHVSVVSDALRNELAPALLPNGRIDASTFQALSFMAARPFRGDRRRGDEPLIDGHDFLAAAAGPDSTSEVMRIVEHPVLWIWLARLTGAVRQ